MNIIELLFKKKKIFLIAFGYFKVKSYFPSLNNKIKIKKNTFKRPSYFNKIPSILCS